MWWMWLYDEIAVDHRIVQCVTEQCGDWCDECESLASQVIGCAINSWLCLQRWLGCSSLQWWELHVVCDFSLNRWLERCSCVWKFESAICMSACYWNSEWIAVLNGMWTFPFMFYVMCFCVESEFLFGSHGVGKIAWRYQKSAGHQRNATFMQSGHRFAQGKMWSMMVKSGSTKVNVGQRKSTMAKSLNGWSKWPFWFIFSIRIPSPHDCTVGKMISSSGECAWVFFQSGTSCGYTTTFMNCCLHVLVCVCVWLFGGIHSGMGEIMWWEIRRVHVNDLVHQWTVVSPAKSLWKTNW